MTGFKIVEHMPCMKQQKQTQHLCIVYFLIIVDNCVLLTTRRHRTPDGWGSTKPSSSHLGSTSKSSINVRFHVSCNAETKLSKRISLEGSTCHPVRRLCYVVMWYLSVSCWELSKTLGLGLWDLYLVVFSCRLDFTSLHTFFSKTLRSWLELSMSS